VVTDLVYAASAVAQHADLDDSPIPPDWVLEGSPRARVSGLVKSPDGRTDVALWDCTAGKFRWEFARDETVYILEGAVHVTCASGAEHLLSAGDVGYFPAGTTSVWTVDAYVKKVAVLHDRRSRVGRRMANLGRRVAGKLARAERAPHLH
jgi:uncharacterized cupin superfamily protein